MQLYAVNFIPLLGSLYMLRVFYTPIIRSTIFELYLQPLVQTIVSSQLLTASVALQATLAVSSGRRRSAKLVPTFADRGVSHAQRNGPPRPLISVFWTGAATFYSSSSSIDLTRLSGPRSRPTTTQKIW